jgi:Ca2+-binding EF-hand superfamily protein
MTDVKKWDDLNDSEKEQISTAFRVIDPDDKQIEEKHLLELLKELGDNFNHEKLAKDLLKQLGKKSGGTKITFEEFREELASWWTK